MTTCAVTECTRPPYCRGWCSLHYHRWHAHGDPLTIKTMRGQPVIERFMAKVRVGADGCWMWTGGFSGSGYGRFAVSHDQLVTAHRWSYERHVGPIPAGQTLDHLCRCRACVNPAHLEPVPLQENLMRGNTLPAANAAKTRCPAGHAYDDVNTYLSASGSRTCRTCRRERERTRRAAAR